MQHDLHPVRYRKTMSVATRRFRHIVMDGARPERLAAEVAGITQAEMEICSKRLNELERCIALWADHGKSVLDTTTLPRGLLSAEPAPFDVDAALFERGLYVHFGSHEDLRLAAPSSDAVDGFYIVNSADSSAGEIIFVCNGPEWSNLEAGPFSNTLRCASRIATLRLTAGAPFSPTFPPDPLTCDPMLLGDGGFTRSLSAAGVVLSILASKNGEVPQEAVRSVH